MTKSSPKPAKMSRFAEEEMSMKSVISQIVVALDKAEKIRATSIVYNGEDILFHLSDGESPGQERPASSDEIEKWLTANDPDNPTRKGHSSS
jgi:hypothetical protein